ncbi:ABC-type glycerol-3-phosphate transport system, substrate-binding protein [Ruminococcaceae bacterium YRB3002]|nr:ABC-type glycerol-3-phosphate transport system, substrate-binding protein [Ruminococcaceae bacterium YRB3002]
MRKLSLTFTASVMAAVVLFTALAGGCADKNSSSALVDDSELFLSDRMPDKLPDGFSWYDFNEDTAIFDYLTETVGGYFLSDVTWFADRTWVFFTETEPRVPVYHIMSFDKDNNVVSDHVIKDEFGDDISLERMVLGDRLYIDAFDFLTYEQYLYPIDENTGSISPDNRIVISKSSPGYEASSRFTFAGNDVAVLKQEDTTGIELVDPADGTVKKNVSLDNLKGDFYIKYPEGLICAGDNKVIVWGSTSSNYDFGQTRYCLVDLETGRISALDEMEYINVPLRNLTYCNGRLVTVTDGGVYSIDVDAGTCNMTLSFNCSVCNRFLANNAELKYADEDRFLFSYSSRYVGANQIPFALCTFTKTGEYPAAGKNIIKVASTGDLDYSISEAIMRFNQESDTSYMLFDNRYKANTEIDYANADSADRAALSRLTSYAAVSDRLRMDILSGDGPDILITDGANEQLSNKECFIDLSDYLKNESGINESGYFMNAIEASRYNGALYQLPIGFYVDCLLASGDDPGVKNGLTFEEYLSMVKTVCNGADPLYDHQLSFSRTEVATRLFANTSGAFIKDGKIDVNCSDFREILDYCKGLPANGYYEGRDIDSEWEDVMASKENMRVQPAEIFGFYEFEEYATKFNDPVICGYPSVDGRTATVGSNIAVSISSHASDVNSCKQFLNILLSEDIQKTLFMNIPVNKKCAKDIALLEIADFNNKFTGNEGVMYATTERAIDTSLADRYIEQLSTASTSAFVYHSISLIIYEEIPAYFEGQKSFDDVAKIINDRAQKVLDERKS